MSAGQYGLPRGYQLRPRKRIAAATARQPWSRDWYFMLADLYSRVGMGWGGWAAAGQASGVVNALQARRALEIAEGPGSGRYRLTPLGWTEMMYFFDSEGRQLPVAPADAPEYPERLRPAQYRPVPTVGRRQVTVDLEPWPSRYGQAHLRAGVAVWDSCGHRAELDIDEHCYTCHRPVRP